MFSTVLDTRVMIRTMQAIEEDYNTDLVHWNNKDKNIMDVEEVSNIRYKCYASANFNKLYFEWVLWDIFWFLETSYTIELYIELVLE